MARIVPGMVIKGRYRIDEFIDAGRMGVVYRVYDLQRKTPLALKALHNDLQEDPRALERFVREGRALQQLAHPNIVPFYGIERSGELTFLLEKFIEGATLKSILASRPKKRIGMLEALIYLKALCAALGYAHLNGVVHCDVKPGNTMIDRNGIIYLTDFGIARHADSATTTLAGAGAPAYMAPEQIKGLPVGPETDIYALGVTLFEMLAGRRPFIVDSDDIGSDTAADYIRTAHLTQAPPDPRRFNPDISEAAAAVMLTALEKDRSRRYASTAEFFAALCAAAGLAPDSVPETASPQPENHGAAGPGIEPPPAWRQMLSLKLNQASVWLRSHPRQAALAGGALVVLLGALLVPRPDPVPEPPASRMPPPAVTPAPPTAEKVAEGGEPIGFTVEPTQRPPTDSHISTLPPPTAIPTVTPLPIQRPPTRTPAAPGPAPVPTYYPLADCAPSRLHPGDWGYISFSSGRNGIRDTADTHPSDNITGYAEPGQVVELIKGPKCNYGWVLWAVTVANQRGLAGWTPEGDGKEFFIEPGWEYPVCPGVRGSRLKIGDTAIVSYFPESKNLLFTTLGENSDGNIPPGREIRIENGPVCRGNKVYWWVYVPQTGQRGYTAELEGRSYYLAPIINEDD